MISHSHRLVTMMASSTAKQAFKRVSHVIFDLDGLLLDTESVYKKAFSDIARRFGKVYTPQIQAKVVGTIDKESARIAVTEMKLPISPQECLHEFKSLAHKSLHSVGIMPGAERLVRHFHSKQVPIAVASSSGEDTYKIKVAKHKDLFSLFSHVVTGGTDPEVKNGKPHPDIFLVCASRFKDKPKPELCLVFEDAPNGVTAAVAAGMQSVIVPDKQIDASLCTAATLKIDSLEKIKPELFGLPAFD